MQVCIHRKQQSSIPLISNQRILRPMHTQSDYMFKCIPGYESIRLLISPPYADS